jgi:hypothetical protein
MRLKSVGDLESDFDERFQIWSPSFLLLGLQQAGRGDGNHGGRRGLTLTMAESLRRARDQLDPPRMSRPRCDQQ